MSSMAQDRDLKTKLHQLECHFTWALIKDDIDVPDVLNKLDEQLKLDVGKKKRLTQTYNSLAYVKFLQGVQEEALSDLMTSVNLYKEEEFNKTLIVTYGNLAWLNYHMKNYPECESYLQKVQKINENISSESSSVPEVLCEKGWAFLKFTHKYYERAKECFKKALDLKPEDGESSAGYAIVLYRTEFEDFTYENSPAVNQLKQAIKTNPDDDFLKVLLAKRLAKYKMDTEAKILVNEALERSPDHLHILQYAGKFFRNRGCEDRAILLLSKALELSPNSSCTHYQLALCYKRKKIYLHQEGSHHAKDSRVRQIRDQIIYHLEMVITQAAGFIPAMSNLALLYGEQGDIAQAQKMFQMAFKTAKEKNDNVHVVHFNYADFQLYSNGCEALAIKHYKDCLKMNPRSHEGKRSEFKLRKIAEKRIYRNTKDREGYGILGFIHKEKGEKHEAIECYEKALSYGDNDEYLTNLCDLRLSIK